MLRPPADPRSRTPLAIKSVMSLRAVSCEDLVIRDHLVEVMFPSKPFTKRRRTLRWRSLISMSVYPVPELDLLDHRRNGAMRGFDGAA